MPLPAGVVPGAAAEAVLKQVQTQLANSPKGTTAAQILQQMTDKGLINCPLVKNPAHICQLSPPVTGPISPPIAP